MHRSDRIGQPLVKCLLDFGASHCFLRSAFAAHFPLRAGRRLDAAGRRLDAAARRCSGCQASAWLPCGGQRSGHPLCRIQVIIRRGLLSGPDSMILGYDWLRAHGLARLFFTTPTLSACAPIGAVRRAAASASISRQQPRQRARRRAPSALCLSPADATARRRCFGSRSRSLPLLGRPALWTPPGAAVLARSRPRRQVRCVRCVEFELHVMADCQWGRGPDAPFHW
jgi:hypothetical protein